MSFPLQSHALPPLASACCLSTNFCTGVHKHVCLEVYIHKQQNSLHPDIHADKCIKWNDLKQLYANNALHTIAVELL